MQLGLNMFTYFMLYTMEQRLRWTSANVITQLTLLHCTVVDYDYNYFDISPSFKDTTTLSYITNQQIRRTLPITCVTFLSANFDLLTCIYFWVSSSSFVQSLPNVNDQRLMKQRIQSSLFYFKTYCDIDSLTETCSVAEEELFQHKEEVCVCARERAREREKERQRQRDRVWVNTFIIGRPCLRIIVSGWGNLV